MVDLTPKKIEIKESMAVALGLSSLEREVVADELAQMAGLRTPARRETEDLLVGVLVNGLRQISGGVWTWAEFQNGALQPLYDLTRREDGREYMTRVATDLGLSHDPNASQDTERSKTLLQRLVAAIEDDLIGAIIVRLQAAGISDG